MPRSVTPAVSLVKIPPSKNQKLKKKKIEVDVNIYLECASIKNVCKSQRVIQRKKGNRARRSCPADEVTFRRVEPHIPQQTKQTIAPQTGHNILNMEHD